MRDIKFRAWDNTNKVMMYGNDTATHDIEYWDGVNCSNVELLNSILSKGYECKDFIWMQYTGLKDKNGKEIYEGDIFNSKIDKRSKDGGYVAGTSAYHPENAKVVQYENGMFKVGLEPLHEFLAFIKLPGHGKDLIGNIYENPELLKK